MTARSELLIPNLPTVEALPSEQPDNVQKLVDKIMAKEQHLSYSSLKRFMGSPNSFVRYKLDKDDKKTQAKDEGNLFHLLVLEPENFDRDYVFDFGASPRYGEGSKAKSENQVNFMEECKQTGEIVQAYINNYSNKKWTKKTEEAAYKLHHDLTNWMEWNDSLSDKKTIVSRAMYEHCYRLAMIVLSHEVAGDLVRRIRQAQADGVELSGTEVRITWEYRGLKFVGYVDGKVECEFIFDLKKTTDASPQKIRRMIQYGKTKYDGWGVQAAAYSYASTNGFDIPYYIVAVDNDYQICVMEISKGKRLEFIQNLNWYVEQFKDCCLEPELFQQSFDFYNRGNSNVYTY